MEAIRPSSISSNGWSSNEVSLQSFFAVSTVRILNNYCRFGKRRLSRTHLTAPAFDRVGKGIPNQ
jgi:hypothetical protein